VRRRQFFGVPLSLLVPGLVQAAREDAYPAVRAGMPLRFPHDHGSHPGFRTEWWYVTGWLQDAAGREFGVQVTFFRNRPRVAETGTSRLAARQLLFAHAAIADPTTGKLVHDQRAGRAVLGLAGADEGDAAVWIDDWFFRRNADVFTTRIQARDFELELAFRQTQPVFEQGQDGLSRKGPRAAQASHYYSLPQLEASGRVVQNEKAFAVSGTAWLDHEWASDYLAAEAAGWDWTGLNFADGSALMLFRIRAADGTPYWAGGALRRADGTRRVFTAAEVAFKPLRHWTSPASGARYPVAMGIRAPGIDLELEPLMDNQELDARASTGTIYWEGAVRVRSAGGTGHIGRGYLELTGYWKTLKL
jgi:predicted secreted hydrolase